MTAWGNRYSALSQEPASIKSTPTLPSTVSGAHTPNLTADHTYNEHIGPPRVSYPPNSSIFVASLPFNILPHEMHEKLTKLIVQFIEPLEVKIIKDKLGNQAAFVQAKTSDDANFLLNSRLFLEGKFLRLEPARAHRTLLLSFKGPQAPLPKLRLLRNSQGYLRAVVNEVTPIEGWIPLRDNDPFSGSGHLFPQFSYAEGSLRKLCELLGTVEEFRRIDNPSVREQPKSGGSKGQNVLPSDNYTHSGVWEVKWSTREEALTAKSLLTTVPFIGWTWAHTMGQTDNPFRGDLRQQYGGFNADTAPFSDNLRTSGNKSKQGPAVLNQNHPDPSKRHSVGLVMEDFPPLVTRQSAPTRSEKVFGKHERAVSEDTDIPITPVSLHHASPEIATFSGEDQSINPLALATPSAKVTPVAAAEYPRLNASYDKSTLYVTGIPQNADESQVKHLFSGYGEITSIRVVANSRGEYAFAFINFDSIESASMAMQASNEKPFTIGYTKLRLRYKKIKPTGRGRGQGRTPGPLAKNPQSTQKYEQATEEGQEMHIAEVDPNVSVVQGNEDIKDNREKVSTVATPPPMSTQETSIGEDSADTFTANVEVQSSAEIKVPSVSDVASNIPVPMVEAVPAVEPLPPKPSYYGYYGPASFPPGYHQHWGYPYPAMYPPVYSFHPYSHPYWYPPGAAPLPPAAYVTPNTLGDNKVEVTHPENPGSSPYNHIGQPSFGFVRPPVAPTGYFHNPDGGITYTYPKEVIEKYTSNETQAVEGEGKGSRGEADSTQLNGLASTQHLQGVQHLSSTTTAPYHPMYHQNAPKSSHSYDVNPAVAAAVYRNYPPLPPPPANKMPQGSFVFNSQGVVQHVEPAAYVPSGHLGGQTGAPSDNGLGLVQAAAAVIANNYHPPAYPSPMGLSPSNQETPLDLQSASSRYSSPVSASGPYYYPHNMHHPAFSLTGPRTHGNPEHQPNAMFGGQGGYKQRASHIMPRPTYPLANAGVGIDLFNGNHHRGSQVV
ncbi:hypothetical protein M408DRAFT_86580 [Serendipita vermifera MAFF 305830]|uniref:RRM domain-containing protein n=1 Tax=Serendipita vermifera MAFF 305830 TaxID=933852 RepID=A0A0C3BP44_SERVB|nr:hypothetical protein M408DRAFT_86580 [Serendipita vermifera MAFF 305830]